MFTEHVFAKIVFDEKLKSLRKNKNKIIQVSFDYLIETVALLKIEDVKHVRNVGDFNYEIEIKGNKDKRSAIFDFAKENGLKILMQLFGMFDKFHEI